jgi:hypothetical protein
MFVLIFSETVRERWIMSHILLEALNTINVKGKKHIKIQWKIEILYTVASKYLNFWTLDFFVETI